MPGSDRPVLPVGHGVVQRYCESGGKLRICAAPCETRFAGYFRRRVRRWALSVDGPAGTFRMLHCEFFHEQRTRPGATIRSHLRCYEIISRFCSCWAS